MSLKDAMNNIQAGWQASRADLEKKEKDFTGVNANFKQMENEVLYSRNCLNAFKEQVASLLSDGFVKVEVNEDKIKESIKLLMTSSKDRGLVISIWLLFRLDFVLFSLFDEDDCINGWQNAAIGQSVDRPGQYLQGVGRQVPACGVEDRQLGRPSDKFGQRVLRYGSPERYSQV